MVTVRSDDYYHLRVVSYRGEPHCFKRRVDDFLEDLYNGEDLNSGVTGRPNIQPPLAFSECKLSEHDEHWAALIRFQLSSSGAHYLTLDGALANFCEKIFKPYAFSIARTLSSRSILGLSAISGTFWRMWYRSLFQQISSEKDTFLRRIEEGFDDVDEYFPDWALALSYAAFTGVIFLTGNPFWNLGHVTEARISYCIAIATSILLKLSTRVELANPDLQEERWDMSHEKLKDDIQGVMRTITQLTDNNHTNELLLCEFLYGAMAAAAKTHIANKELLLAYVKLHKEARRSMIANGVFTGAYLAGITSAFSVTTTTTALPLSQWTLSQAAAWLLLAEAPVVQTTALVFPSLFGLSMIGAVGFFGWASRNQDKKKRDIFAKKVDYHRKLNAFIGQAWNIAHHTYNVLRLVHCIGADRMDVEFVNDEARLEWVNTIRRYNEAGGRTTPTWQFEPRYIIIFLDEQRRDFEAWHEDLAAHEAQFV